MFESDVCNSSARLERETLTTVASIWARNDPITATEEILQRCGSGSAVSGGLSSRVDAIGLSGRVAAMEAAEVAGAEQTQQNKPRSQRCHMGGRTQAEVPDAADQDISDGK